MRQMFFASMCATEKEKCRISIIKIEIELGTGAKRNMEKKIYQLISERIKHKIMHKKTISHLYSNRKNFFEISK